MTPPKHNSSLSKLEQQRADLDAKIRAEKRKERKRQADDERQRYRILGRAVAKEIAENESLALQLEPVLNARITKASERRFLGLPPIQKSTPPSAGQ